ncbi:hypothetical protein BB560_004252 [Smittium megazygosporum]|uniref:YCII-related domain-containing protein n=1 Tax=Smittium megazygosporum TaxID=133381 RepID=A0A2T9Z9R0_9FUNG|nr:hypothetical protein BB560_004252 [Smittium megazygosporum]
MKEYLVLIKDFTDPECINRRLSVREHHLTANSLHKQNGNVMVLGGALADKDGRMVASSIVCKAETKEEVIEFLKNDIYVKSNVWDMSTLFITEI